MAMRIFVLLLFVQTTIYKSYSFYPLPFARTRIVLVILSIFLIDSLSLALSLSLSLSLSLYALPQLFVTSVNMLLVSLVGVGGCVLSPADFDPTSCGAARCATEPILERHTGASRVGG
jgi:hypothetical protein